MSTVECAPSAKALERIAEARDYHYRVIEPVIEKAIQTVIERSIKSAN